MSDELTFGSLFAGIGGLDLGLERAGWTVRWQVERDEWCRSVLAKHWPDVPRYGDVRHVHDLRRTRCINCIEPVDLIAGGFPCQPVSLAGRRRGAADERWLWPEFARLIRLLRPRYVLVENVPGLLTGDGMAEVLGDLAALGFDAEWECVPAAAVGAPHLRWRVFIVAYVPDSPQRPDLGGQSRPGQRSLAGGNGQAPVADPDPGGRDGRPRLVRPPGRGRPENGGGPVVNATGIGRRQGPRVFRGLGTEERGRWSSEPDVGRVAHGVPARVDRLRGLGNAVVPQVAEVVGRMIADHAHRTAP